MSDTNHDNYDIEEIKRNLIEQQNLNSNNKKSILNFNLQGCIPNNDYFESLVNSIKKTVKCEDALIRQISYAGFSSYIEDDPINLGILAPTSEGKTYAVEESMKFFPKEDVYKIGSMSAKVLVRERGILVDENLNPIEDRLRKLKKIKNSTKDQEEKEEIIEEIEKLYEKAKTLIDLRHKILVFLEPPQKDVWDIIKPILSHDSLEIEYPFVNHTDKEGHETKKVIVRGWPSCIFCSARDESRLEVWAEIKSRFVISSPNMIPEKYQKSISLISQTKGLPNSIQQQVIISDKEIKIAKNCVSYIKKKIEELKSKNNDAKISVWIPYYRLLEKEFPTNKGTDVRFVKRVFSLLNIVSIVKYNLRKILILGDETSIIADLEDLKEVLSITQNFDGIAKYKMDFFNNIFYSLFTSKNSKPDENKDGTKKEDIPAVTARQLCDHFKLLTDKPISTDILKKTYLNELINNGIVDYDISKINAKQYIYYPIGEPNLTNNEENNKNSLSLLSKSNHFDTLSQQSLRIYEIITKSATEEWIFSEIMRMFCYRNDLDNFAGQLADYFNNHKEFQLLDNSVLYELKEKQEQSEEKKNNNIKNECLCATNDNNGRLTVREFIEKYTKIPEVHFDNNLGSNIASFGKISPIISNLANIDKKDNKNIDDIK